jgi:hypothetical protein
MILGMDSGHKCPEATKSIIFCKIVPQNQIAKEILTTTLNKIEKFTKNSSKEPNLVIFSCGNWFFGTIFHKKRLVHIVPKNQTDQTFLPTFSSIELFVERIKKLYSKWTIVRFG